MSHTNLDPALTATEDALFRRDVLAFIQNHAPAAMNPASHAELRNLVMSYIYTSRNLEMARLLLSLHRNYGISTLIAAEHLTGATNTVNGVQSAPPITASPTTPAQNSGSDPANTPQRHMQSPRAMQFNSPPSQMRSPTGTSVYPSSPLDSSSPGQRQHTSPTGSNSSFGQTQNPLASRFNSPPDQMQARTTSFPNHPPSQLKRCFPPGLRMESDTPDRDLKWCYKCDECHHPIVHRSEFNRHARDAGRDGFRVVASNTTQRVWYGSDTPGNEYTGEMIPADERPPPPRHVGEPCQTRISQHNASKKREQASAKNKEGGN
ncbi:hypothetical protein H2200_003491 [Cladophialophora chaetospira]|uniref:Uncharacterized protein n=1 Tax=Cladophialophora chaetospira TaxID=386627 RepID=A0AA39CLG5_9EURO|nr:hypothetical protein H2200_003491 [Cladophialophora chaetospira]